MSAGSAQPFMTAGAAASGGAAAYGSGSEVNQADLAGGTLTLTAASMKKVHLIYSSVDGAQVVLPASNATGMALGQYIGFQVDPQSRPIQFLNAGTLGTDAVLEALGMPGADFKLYVRSVSSVVGNWRKGPGSSGLYPGLVPAKMPLTADAGIDLGSTAGSMNGVGGNLTQSISVCKLSATQYVVVLIPSAGTSVLAYPVSYNFATDAWTWGSSVTVASHASNVFSYPRIVAIDATHYAIAVWQATAATYTVRAGSVAANAITQGTAITSGAWTMNPSSNAWTSAGTMIKDSASSFFIAGCYDGSHLGIAHFTLTGNNAAHDASAAFGSSAVTSGGNEITGASTAANTIDLGIGSTGKYGVSRYTYNAGGPSITNTFNLTDAQNGGCQQLACADATARVYYGTAASGGSIMRLVVNAGLTDFSHQQKVLGPYISVQTAIGIIFGAGGGAGMLFISDDECLIFNAPSSGNNFFALFNPRRLFARGGFAETTTADPQQHRIQMQQTLGAWLNTIYGTAFDATTRSFAVLYSTVGQSVAINRGFYMAMHMLPRNYDATI